MVKRRRGQARLEAVHEEEEVVAGAAADQLRRQLRVGTLAAANRPVVKLVVKRSNQAVKPSLRRPVAQRSTQVVKRLESRWN